MNNWQDYLECFKNHEVHILTNTKNVQQFICQNKNRSYDYMFEVLCTDKAIYVSGDIGETIITPGYGRGLNWLRGSINNQSYFHEKISGECKTYEFSLDKALEDVKNHFDGSDDPDEKNNKKVQKALDKLQNLFDYVNENVVYEVLYDYGLEPEGSYGLVPTSWSKARHAGLVWLCSKLDKMNFRINEQWD